MATPAASPAGAAEYWHIGGIHTRLGIVTDRRVYGSNRALTEDSRGSEGGKAAGRVLRYAAGGLLR
ncbi:hypothetical protein GCM10010358_50320 [Streptomyces minutiscleroticus]|uniref:Uncharacterized protein n=1 Tax=Streptomyces minutiscleroticus TaxID=68238 RepID=A0A918U478_9ACTN|nr:hypothetical protein GCM10010358_50320 [Streptomyces minutiscleroticus]